MQEASRINTSLLTLRRCINALAEGKSRSHVPFRDSKLTRLLQNTLGGSGRTAIVCTVNASVAEEEEALSTLRFAAAAATVSNVVVANVTERSTAEWQRMLTTATRTIRQLEAQLNALRAGQGGGYRSDTASSCNTLVPWERDPSPSASTDVDMPPLPPSDLVCPLSHAVFTIPVVAMDGHTYEKAAILEYFRQHGDSTSPRDGTVMESGMLIPNRVVAAQAARYRSVAGVHVSINAELDASAAPWRLDEMPLLVLVEVCSYLLPSSIAALAQTCRRLRAETASSMVWDRLLRLHFGTSRRAQQFLSERRSRLRSSHMSSMSKRDEYKAVWVHCAAMNKDVGLPRQLVKAMKSHRAAVAREEERRKKYQEGCTPHVTDLKLLA